MATTSEPAHDPDCLNATPSAYAMRQVEIKNIYRVRAANNNGVILCQLLIHLFVLRPSGKRSSHLFLRRVVRTRPRCEVAMELDALEIVHPDPIKSRSATLDFRKATPTYDKLPYATLLPRNEWPVFLTATLILFSPAHLRAILTCSAVVALTTKAG